MKRFAILALVAGLLSGCGLSKQQIAHEVWPLCREIVYQEWDLAEEEFEGATFRSPTAELRNKVDGVETYYVSSRTKDKRQISCLAVKTASGWEVSPAEATGKTRASIWSSDPVAP